MLNVLPLRPPSYYGWWIVFGDYDAAFLVYVAGFLLAALCYTLFAPPPRRPAVHRLLRGR